MSDRERIINIIDSLSAKQLNDFLRLLTGFVGLTSDLDDDEYCARLYEKYSEDSEQDKNDNMDIQDFASELGIAL